jgi:hypothetical protein
MIELVSHARLWWRRWSTWLAGIFAIITGAVTANPGLLVGLIGYFPQELRGFIAGAVAVLVFALPVIVAHVRQPKLAAKVAELKDAEK